MLATPVNSYFLTFSSYSAAMWRLTEDLHPFIGKKDTNYRDAHGTPVRIGVFLSYIARGMPYGELSAKFAVGKSTVRDILVDVAWAISKVYAGRRKDMMYPSNVADIVALERGFRTLWGLPGACGAIDGTHFPILKPEIDGDNYVNRKNWASIAGLFVASADLYCLDARIGYPGGAHDARMWRESSLKGRIDAGGIPFRSMPKAQVCCYFNSTLCFFSLFFFFLKSVSLTSFFFFCAV